LDWTRIKDGFCLKRCENTRFPGDTEPNPHGEPPVVAWQVTFGVQGGLFGAENAYPPLAVNICQRTPEKKMDLCMCTMYTYMYIYIVYRYIYIHVYIDFGSQSTLGDVIRGMHFFNHGPWQSKPLAPIIQWLDRLPGF
jgi:hypothetical protein